MTLEEALQNIQYDSSWGIWAELNEKGYFDLESEARYGQRIFENGGVLDDKVYVCNGQWPSDLRVIWCNGCIEDEEWDSDFMEWLLDKINESLMLDREYDSYFERSILASSYL